jgi:hypothetical protein
MGGWADGRRIVGEGVGNSGITPPDNSVVFVQYIHTIHIIVSRSETFFKRISTFFLLSLLLHHSSMVRHSELELAVAIIILHLGQIRWPQAGQKCHGALNGLGRKRSQVRILRTLVPQRFYPFSATEHVVGGPASQRCSGTDS